MSMPALCQAVLESSLAQLSMQAEFADLRSQNDLLKSEQQRLESEIKEVQVRNRQQERRIQPLKSPTSNPTALPRRQGNPLHHRRRPAFHIIRLPLRRLHPRPRPLLPSHPHPLAQESSHAWSPWQPTNPTL